MARAFGIDISKYQASADGKKRMDFSKVARHSEPIAFIAARAGVSWGYQDPQFSYHWSEMGKLKVGRIAYHVPYFGESAVAQMDALFKMLENKSDWRYDRIALDLEVAGINTKARITSTTLNCLEIVKTRIGRYPLVYSRANWVDQYLQVSDLPKLDWWLATYRKAAPSPFYTSEHPGPPYLPKGVSTYLIHQTGDHCKAIGAASYYMDYNRWNGDAAAVLSYFNNPASAPTPEPPKPNLKFKAKCMVNSLRKRSGPGLTYSIIGYLSLGEVVSVYEEVNGWFKIDQNADVWCSGAANYMQRLDANAPQPPQVKRAQCIVRALYLREGPGKTYKIIGNLVRNDVVTVYGVKNGWYRISSTKQVWCSGESQYMNVLA